MICLWFFGFLGLRVSASGQGYNYHYLQYGGRTQLLGGAVVAGTQDVSMLFYNPSVVARMDYTNLSFGATGYQHDRTCLMDGAGRGIDLCNQPTFQVPVIVGGGIRLGKDSPHRLAYGVLQRFRFEFEASARHEGLQELIPEAGTPQPEPYFAEVSTRLNQNEVWVGLGYAFAWNERIALGISQFVAHHHSLDELFDDLTLLHTGGTRTGNYNRFLSFRYDHLRTFWKLGFSWKLNKDWQFGLTLTTPGIGILGKGLARGKFSVSNLPNRLPDFVVSARQEVSVDFRSPAALALGARWKRDETAFLATLTWHHALTAYTLFDLSQFNFAPPPGTGLEGSTERWFPAEETRRHVVNLALGVDHPLTDRLHLAGSFRTDFSYVSPRRTRSRRYTVGAWNLFHLTAGMIYSKPRADLSLGLTHAFSFSQATALTDLKQPGQYFLADNRRSTSVRFLSFGLIVFYQYYFGDREAPLDLEHLYREFPEELRKLEEKREEKQQDKAP